MGLLSKLKELAAAIIHGEGERWRPPGRQKRARPGRPPMGDQGASPSEDADEQPTSRDGDDEAAAAWTAMNGPDDQSSA